MELTKTKDKVNTSKVFGKENEKINMEINQERMAHIVHLLTDLYPDPIAATVREVISNAIDTTNRLPKEDRKPVYVSLPTEFDLSFVVEDFGEGMSKDTLAKNYSQYGASTKEDDFSQIGAFGLGAKAPLSYASKFTVESTKDGITTEVFLTSSASGNQCEFISEEKTDKPNGTIVTIPVQEKDIYRFQESANTYKKYSLDTKVMFSKGDVSYESEMSLYKVGEIKVAENNGEPVYTDFYIDMNRPISEMTEADIALKLLKDKKQIQSSVRYSHYNISEDFGFMLSGWLYKGPKSYYNSSKYLLDLKPGMVNFSSSRDEITDDSRYDEFSLVIKENMYDVVHSKFTELINKLGFNGVDLINYNIKQNNGLSDFFEIAEEETFTVTYPGITDFVEDMAELDFDFIAHRELNPKDFSYVDFYDRYESNNSFKSQSQLLQRQKDVTLNEYHLLSTRAKSSASKVIIVTDTKKTTAENNRKVKAYATSLGLYDSSKIIVAYTKETKEKVVSIIKEKMCESIFADTNIITEDEFIEDVKIFNKKQRVGGTKKDKPFFELEELDEYNYCSTYRYIVMEEKSKEDLISIKENELSSILILVNKKVEMKSRDISSTVSSINKILSDNFDLNKKNSTFYLSYRTAITKANAAVLSETFDKIIIVDDVELTQSIREDLKPITFTDLKINVEPNTILHFAAVVRQSPNVLNDICNYFGKVDNELTEEFYESFRKVYLNGSNYNLPEETSELEDYWVHEFKEISNAIDFEYINKYTESIVNDFTNEFIAFLSTLKK